MLKGCIFRNPCLKGDRFYTPLMVFGSGSMEKGAPLMFMEIRLMKRTVYNSEKKPGVDVEGHFLLGTGAHLTRPVVRIANKVIGKVGSW